MLSNPSDGDIVRVISNCSSQFFTPLKRLRLGFRGLYNDPSPAQLKRVIAALLYHGYIEERIVKNSRCYRVKDRWGMWAYAARLEGQLVG